MQKEGTTVVVRRNPQHKSFEIPSSVFRIPIGNLDLVASKVRLIVPGNTEVHRVNMNTVRSKFTGKKALSNDLVE